MRVIRFTLESEDDERVEGQVVELSQIKPFVPCLGEHAINVLMVQIYFNTKYTASDPSLPQFRSTPGAGMACLKTFHIKKTGQVHIGPRAV
ncbi:hypothetical protein EVAR_33136_1 [Eumeta japonica]|uniref:Uncharacterized protein n=1 Tax=Eumeta variegata TaxID=151549 RepID=A0A4C1Y8T4_EUMVA|nr:hypothetical protein EVAR_33136_1 [Eumeta japonica]